MYLNRQNITLWETEWETDPFRVEQIEVNENFVKSVGQSGRETQPSPTLRDSFKEQPSIVNGKGITFLLSIPILFLATGFILKIGWQKINQAFPAVQRSNLLVIRKNQLKFVKNHPKIACRQCQFFDNNHYLKCAVHPDQVLKKEARDCLDYQEKNNTKNHS